MTGFMSGFRKGIKGGTSEFVIKAPPFPRRCHLQVRNGKSILESMITDGNNRVGRGREASAYSILITI